MRLILGITLMLLGVGIWSCHIDSLAASAPKAVFDTPWVRTADGWERPGSWQVTPPSTPRLHPLVVASGQLLLSLLALAAGPGKQPLKRPLAVVNSSQAKS